LLRIDGIISVFYGPNFITVTKAGEASWSYLKPQVFTLISETVTSGEEIVRNNEDESRIPHEGELSDTLAHKDDDSEVVGLIKELLDTRIRPAIQDDGGDIEFRGFEEGKVLLKLRGACRTCDSSTVTLRNGIETMLKHYVRFTNNPRILSVTNKRIKQIEEVKGVIQIVDAEEEISIKEFERLESKLNR
jgi:NFU1 iron-sulfur cluster scaffold homolog, mitochondrial